MDDQLPTLLDFVKAFIIFILGSGVLLLILNVAGRLYRRGRDYVTVQDVPTPDGEWL